MNRKFSEAENSDFKFKVSKNSIKRFIKLFIEINDTPYWYHQTLTFKQAITDVQKAKRDLKRLLDSLEKAFPEMGVIFVQGLQKRIGIHFHLFLFFYPKIPIGMPEDFLFDLRKAVFSRWNAIQGGKLVRQANVIRLHKKDVSGLHYFLEHHVQPTNEKQPRQSLWNGSRNKTLIQANSSKCNKKDISTIFNDCFPKIKKLRKMSAPLFTARNLKNLKAEVDFHNVVDWESFKKQELKTKRKISNLDYIAFRNGEKFRNGVRIIKVGPGEI